MDFTAKNHIKCDCHKGEMTSVPLCCRCPTVVAEGSTASVTTEHFVLLSATQESMWMGALSVVLKKCVLLMLSVCVLNSRSMIDVVIGRLQSSNIYTSVTTIISLQRLYIRRNYFSKWQIDTYVTVIELTVGCYCHYNNSTANYATFIITYLNEY